MISNKEISLDTAQANFTSRRGFARVFGAALAASIVTKAVAGESRAAQAAPSGDLRPLTSEILPAGVRSRFVSGINGLRMHVLEAGFEGGDRPLVLLLHGFPELAYSWRHVMPALASAGYHVIAPDRRGYGRTATGIVSYDEDLVPFGTLNQVQDVVSLVLAFGYRSVQAVVGHDQGSPLAGWCALIRPDVFRSVAMMSAPFGGTATLPFKTANGAPPVSNPVDTIYDDLARLSPPRKHYQRYYQTHEANENLWHPRQGLHSFLRAYYHMKSADWEPNAPHRLGTRTATEWAKLPRYYVMDLDQGMSETVAKEMPSAAEIAACRWLTEAELDVYTAEYGRTGFQGGLNGYRLGEIDGALKVFAGRKIDVPAMFVGGRKDWGIYQSPGALERLETAFSSKYEGTELVDGAGHWVQQEQPVKVSSLLIKFLVRH